MFKTLEIRNLHKSFGKKLVLNNVNYLFHSGVYGLLGPNGSGKTTLLRCLIQHYKEGHRSVFLNGEALKGGKDALSHIGYLPQHFATFAELNVRESLLLIARLRGLDMAKDKLEERILTCLKHVRLDDRLSEKTGRLSGGMLRRLGIAQALLSDPDILVFDEATAGLDPEERLKFKELVRSLRENRLIILSTHIVEDVEHCCDKILIMHGQNIHLHGESKTLLNSMLGNVYIVPERKLAALKGKYRVIRTQESSDGPLLRILTEESQDLPEAIPTLEDFYMYHIGEER